MSISSRSSLIVVALAVLVAACGEAPTQPDVALDSQAIDDDPGASANHGGTYIDVTTTLDIVDGTTTSIVILKDNPGDDEFISLREAIIAANSTGNTDGAVKIILQAGVFQLSLSNLDGIGEDAAATGDLDVTDVTDALTDVTP